MSEDLLKFFNFPRFQDFAQDIIEGYQPSAERTITIRKLLEAEDAFIRLIKQVEKGKE